MQREYTLQSKTFKIEIDADFDMYDYQIRFVICDKDGAVIDDAQGYGYKTAAAAHKAAWYKLNGGKEKVDGAKKAAIEFASTHGIANFDPKMAKYL